MVQQQIESRGISDATILGAMRKVPRHLFVPENEVDKAYDDHPIELCPGSSISQPYTVAYMLEVLRLTPHDKVLEIGTGSGYQTALLCELVHTVYSIDLNRTLTSSANSRLAELGYRNFFLRSCDGSEGWAQRAPFDAIIVTAACSEIPRELVKQLGPYGRMIFPLDGDRQYLILLEKNEKELQTTELCAVKFLPMVRDETSLSEC